MKINISKDGKFNANLILIDNDNIKHMKQVTFTVVDRTALTKIDADKVAEKRSKANSTLPVRDQEAMETILENKDGFARKVVVEPVQSGDYASEE